jgi:DNA repair photolyase
MSFTSPVSTPGRARRRAVRQPALFPTRPDTDNPKIGAVENPDQVRSGSRDSVPGRPPVDCPPPFRPSTTAQWSSNPQGSQSQADGRTRNSAAQPGLEESACSEAGASEPLVGIARLAASSPPADTCRKSEERPEYFLLPVRSILNRCDSDRVPFEWTINPYRGCEFGCKYCYARYTHEYMELDGGSFEKKIFVKKDAGPLLAWDISKKYSFASHSSGGEEPDHIAIGTATDPYQPAEREHKVTRACLEEIARREGLSVSIITKSNQIVRDIDVLKTIAERSSLHINITVTTMRARLARLLEPRAPRPDLRMAAVKQLRDSGLAVGISASPLIPGITDRDGDLEAVAAAGKAAGAQWFFSGVLFLMPSSAKQFLPFVREKFPRLAKQYEEWYSRNGYAPEEFRKKISERVARIRQEYGFSVRPWVEKARPAPCSQLKLWSAA